MKWGTGKGQHGRQCNSCGQSHPPRKCPAYGQTFYACKKKNHFKNCCRSRTVRALQDDGGDSDDCESDENTKLFVGVIRSKSKDENTDEPPNEEVYAVNQVNVHEHGMSP